MKNNKQSWFISTLLFLSAAFSCTKDTGNPANPSADQTCRVTMTATAGSPGNTNISQYFYTADHVLDRVERYVSGNPSRKDISKLTISAHTFRTDALGTNNGVQIYHSGYTIGHLNGNNKIDSITSFNCVDCNKANPDTFKLHGYELFKFDSQSKLLRYESHFESGASFAVNLFEYDAKGRVTKETDYDAVGGGPIRIITYLYAANEAENYSTGEPDDITNAIIGASMSVKPVAVILDDGSGNLVTSSFINKSNADGYLESTTLLSNGAPTNVKTTYTYGCYKK